MSQIRWIVLIIAIGLLALVSVSPFLTDAMPLTDDGNLHVYRSIVLDDAMRNDGSWYPRYASALAYGYGAPLFNYFPPTSYYPIVGFHAIGLDWILAWKTTLILYVVLAGLGTFLWARQWLDDIGAFIAAVGYMYAPYTLFDTVTRGSSNEFAGMALLPFALWGFTRLARYGRRGDYLLAVFSYVLFIMAHNVMTLYGSLLLVGYCLVLWLLSEKSTRVIWQLGTAGIFAVLITAFFWMPALLETDLVKINGVLDNLDFVDVTNTLRPLGDIFALPQTADPSQLQATVPITFSWVLIVLAVIGFFLPQPPQDATTSQNAILGHHVFLFVVLIVVVFSQVMASAEFWQSVRLLQYSQFAWRPMSIGSLALAFLAGIGGSYAVRLVPTLTGKITGLIVILGLIILYSVPWLYRPTTDLTAETVRDAQRYEVVSRQPVLSSFGEYLPAQTIQTALNTENYLDDSSRIVENDDYTILELEEESRRLSAEIDVTNDTAIAFEWLFIEGWRATIDGDPVGVMPIGDAGLVGFDIAVGTHQIEVWYGQTGTQQLATAISAITIIIVFLLTLNPVFNPLAIIGRDVANDNILSLPMIVVVGLVGLGLFAIKSTLLDQVDSAFRNAQFEDGILRGIDAPTNVNFDDQIRLLGTDIETQVPSGERATVRLYWTLEGDGIDTNYSTIVQLVDTDGIIIAEATRFFPAGLATSNWIPDYYLEDTIELQIPAYTPPNTYNVVVGLYRSDTGQRLEIINDVGNATGIDYLASAVAVERPNESIRLTDATPLYSAFGYELLAINGLPETAQVGDEIVISWVWRAFDPSPTIQPQIFWDDADFVTVPTLVNGFAQEAWRDGDIWRGYHRFYVPSTLNAGNYDLLIGFGDRRETLNQSMSVTVPAREFVMPDFTTSADVLWQNGIRLLGYDTTDTSISLIWQSDDVINQNLRLFVQVFNADGQLLANSDGVPVNNQRPTTGWVRTEFITTEHVFGDLPVDDDLMILIGWYDPLTGDRIPLADGNESGFQLDYLPE